MINEVIMPEVDMIDQGEINAKYAEVASYINYLADTDFMTQREADGGKKMPLDVRRKRAEARVHISKLRSDIAVLEGMEAAMSDLEYAKEIKKVEIEAYDLSDNVNIFTLQGRSIWLSPGIRVNVANSTSKRKAMGYEITQLWHDGVRYDLPIVAAEQMLAKLEIYALDCYNVTQQHLSTVSKLTSVEDVEKYDYTTGYPEKLVL